jgi:hypothetical protein
MLVLARQEDAHVSTFTPTHEWQDLPPGTVLPAGCQVRFDFESERTQARLANGNGAADPDFGQTYAKADAWPEVIPLFAEHEASGPYPIDVLPPTLRGAIQSYQAFGQQPLSMVACSALSAVSLACQGLADVDRDGNLRGPLFTLIHDCRCIRRAQDGLRPPHEARARPVAKDQGR